MARRKGESGHERPFAEVIKVTRNHSKRGFDGGWASAKEVTAETLGLGLEL